MRKENKHSLRMIFKLMRVIKVQKRENNNLGYASYCLGNVKHYMYFYNKSSKQPVAYNVLCEERENITLEMF